jgi:hypothetical protein
LRLLRPAAEPLLAYAAGLERGWSPDPGCEAAREQLARPWADPAAFLRDLNQPYWPGTRLLLQQLFWI